METHQKINPASVQKLGNSSAKKIIALDYASFHHLLGEPIFGFSDANVYAVKKYGGRPDRPPAITPFKIHSALSTSYDLCERYNLPMSIEYLNSVISSTQEYMLKAVRAVEGWDLLYLHRGSLFYQDGSIRLA
ncbi:MAG: hypothetical protein V1728_00205, partial [Candidatus Micrarchaeota archaeon]